MTSITPRISSTTDENKLAVYIAERLLSGDAKQVGQGAEALEESLKTLADAGRKKLLVDKVRDEIEGQGRTAVEQVQKSNAQVYALLFGSDGVDAARDFSSVGGAGGADLRNFARSGLQNERAAGGFASLQARHAAAEEQPTVKAATSAGGEATSAQQALEGFAERSFGLQQAEVFNSFARDVTGRIDTELAQLKQELKGASAEAKPDLEQRIRGLQGAKRSIAAAAKASSAAGNTAGTIHGTMLGIERGLAKSPDLARIVSQVSAGPELQKLLALDPSAVTSDPAHAKLLGDLFAAQKAGAAAQAEAVQGAAPIPEGEAVDKLVEAVRKYHGTTNQLAAAEDLRALYDSIERQEELVRKLQAEQKSAMGSGDKKELARVSSDLKEQSSHLGKLRAHTAALEKQAEMEGLASGALGEVVTGLGQTGKGREALALFFKSNVNTGDALTDAERKAIDSLRRELESTPTFHRIKRVVEAATKNAPQAAELRNKAGLNDFEREFVNPSLRQPIPVETGHRYLPKSERMDWSDGLTRAYENFHLVLANDREVAQRTDNTLASILGSNLPIEMVILLVMMALTEREEQKFKLKIEEVNLVEQLQREGKDPVKFGFPAKSVNMLMQELQAAMTMYSQVMQALSAVLRQIQDLIQRPIQNIR